MNNIRILKQDVLTIGKGVVLSKDSFIQMKNITRVWFGKAPVDIPYGKFILFLFVGMALMPTAFATAGVLAIIGDIAFIAYYIYLRSHYCLSFELSSGQIYAFRTLQKEFLEESYSEVKRIMNDEKGTEKGVEINFNDCKINIVGENNGNVTFNTVDNSAHNTSQSNNTNSFNQNSFNTNIDLTVVEKEMEALLEKLKEDDAKEDIEYIQKAKTLVKSKNEKEAINTLKKVSKNTMRAIEMSAAFATLYQFITSVVK